MKLQAKVKSVESVTPFGKERRKVVLRGLCGELEIVLEMRPHELRAYTIGRMVDVELNPVKK